LEISSLQQTLVGHLSTQEEYVNQLVTDAQATSENIGKGNKELKRATERKSTAQMVFWGTVGLCTWLVVWDAIF
jgi:t-SNARE complex subunit (syntaxin)